MPTRKPIAVQELESLVERALADAPVATRLFELLAASLAMLVDDPRHVRSVGRILEEIAERKLYRLGRHATWDAFLRNALGLSRATAYRLRRIALAPGDAEIPRRGKMAAYESARAVTSTVRARRPKPKRSRPQRG